MDSNATTPLLPEVFEAMRPFFLEQFGNASSIHHHGQHARAAVEQARASVAALVKCRASEVVFTSGGTEADNLALFGVCRAGDHVIVSAIEHHAVLHAAASLEKRGCTVTRVPVDSSGLVSAEDIRRAVRPETRLISVMMANNETGVLQPVEAIGRVAAEAGVLFHTDAVQAAGKVEIDVQRVGCHLLSISGHKMHAPQGTGALIVRKGVHLEPLFHGGNHERQRRAGTENLAGIVGLGEAAEMAAADLRNGKTAKMQAMRDRLQREVLAQIDETGVNGANGDGVASAAPRVPQTSNIYFDHIEGEALVVALDLKGLAVSTGAACSSGAIEPSHVLVAMGLSPARARASIRFSLGKHNTESDVDFALSVLPQTVARLRELSPVYRKRGAPLPAR